MIPSPKATALILLAIALPATVNPDPVRAQEGVEPTIVGAVVGYTTTTGIWKPAAESEVVGGGVIGGFITAATPIPWFAIRAEGSITQRNSDVLAVAGDQTVRGGVRTDYVSVAIHARVSAGLGPIRIHVTGGPTVDQILRSRLDANLRPVLNREASMVLGAGASVGVGTTVSGRYRVEVEARLFEGLGDSYSGDFVQMRNRSIEFVTRVGIPRPGR